MIMKTESIFQYEMALELPGLPWYRRDHLAFVETTHRNEPIITH